MATNQTHQQSSSPISSFNKETTVERDKDRYRENARNPETKFPTQTNTHTTGGGVSSTSIVAKQKFIAMHKETLQRLKTLNINNKETSESLNYFNKDHILNSLPYPQIGANTTSHTPGSSSITSSSTYSTSSTTHSIQTLSDSPFEIEKISKAFAKENLKFILNENLKSDITQLSLVLEKRFNKLSQIVDCQKNVEQEFTSLMNEIKNFENELNMVIEKNSEFITKNQNFLIRNEILKTFIDKMIITKEERDNLINKSLIDDSFFKLILKLKQIKFDIVTLERNSENFSKTLLFSIKENFQIVEDLMNEKIVLYLKNLFRSKTKFEFSEFKNVVNTINFLREKENYLNFILKEFTQMRKKFLDKILRNKFLKISKLDEVFASLIEDFEFHFLKEFVILYNLFSSEGNYEQQSEIFTLLNYDSENCMESTMKNLEKLIEEIIKKNFNGEGKLQTQTHTNKNEFYIHNLNTILYVMEELFYENVNLKNTNTQSANNTTSSSSSNTSNTDSKTNSYSPFNSFNQSYTQTQSPQIQFQFFSQSNQIKTNLSEVYKITILSTFYHTKIEKLLTVNLKFPLNMINDNLNLLSMINNYKKSFSNVLSKILNECHKNLVKIQNSFKKEDSTINQENTLAIYNTSTSNHSRNLILLSEEFSKCFESFEKFSYMLKEEDKENLTPKNKTAFKVLINFFTGENSHSHLNLSSLMKAFNIIEIFCSKFKKFADSCNLQEEMQFLENSLHEMEILTVSNFVELILKSTNFEDNLKSNFQNDTVMNFMEHLLEKCQFYFLNFDVVHDFQAKENLKEKIKKKIIKIYGDILEKEDSCGSMKGVNSNVFSEEEFSNYLELL